MRTSFHSNGPTMKLFSMILPLLLASIVFALVVSPGVAAESPTVIHVWSGMAPGEPKDLGPEVTQPAKAGENPPTTRITNISSPTMTVFLPPADKRNGTAVVICPGGGYNILAWDKEGTEVAEWLNTLGVSAFVLKYRTPTSGRMTPWLAPAQDAQRAISVVRHRASEWNLSDDRIGLLGFSAGGSTAAQAALKSNARLYEVTDDADRTSCRPDFVTLIYPAYLVDDKGQLKSDLIVTKESSPMFLAHAFNDPISCENSVQLFLALKKATVPADLHIYSSGGHGFGLRPSEQPASTWPKRCEEWMKQRGLLTRQPASK
jgi:acetyl esterase/lipase